MNADEKRDMLLQAAFGTIAKEVDPAVTAQGIVEYLTPHVESIYEVWDGGPGDIVDLMNAVRAAISPLVSTHQMIDMTTRLEGPSLELLIERDLSMALIGQLTLISEATLVPMVQEAVRVLGSYHVTVQAFQESLDKALSFPSAWMVEAVRSREYYAKPLRDLAKKMNVSMEGMS